MKESFNYKQKLVLIGICAVTTVLMFFFGYNYLKGINVFKRTTPYYASFSNITGVDVATKVFINGYEVGNVRSINFDYDTFKGAVVELALDKSLRVPMGTRVIVRNNPLGTGSLHLMLPEHFSANIAPKDTLLGEQEANVLSRINDELIPNVNATLLTVDSLLESLGDKVNNPDIPEILSQLNASTKAIQSSTRKLDRLMDNQVPEIVGNVNSASSSMRDVASTLEQADIEKTLSEFTQTISELRKVSAQLSRGEGTLGLLLNDSTLYRKLDATVLSADSLLRDIQKNPKRYVKFSVF